MPHSHAAEIAQALPYAYYTECHFVSEGLQSRFGWEREEGVWVSDSGELYGLHLWNVLPDGCLLDATASQLGDPTVQVAVAVPGTPEYDRYVPWAFLTHAEHRQIYLGLPHPGLGEYANPAEAARMRRRVPPAGRRAVEEADPHYLRDR